MSIVEILKQQKKKRQLREVESDPKFGIILNTLREEQLNYLEGLKTVLEEDLEAFKANISNGSDGKDADEEIIIDKILNKIPKPKDGADGKTPIKGKDYFDGKDGKDADEDGIFKRLLNKIKQPKDGKDGYTPIKGKDYFDGENGLNGSPDTPEQIIEKLNTLEDVLEPKVIKGFWAIINKLQTAIREKSGGGGMGNVQHESKSVSSATTSVTTTYGIAGGGFALWAYYQGQLIMRGEHYTVLGNTLTLTFTPENNTTIDIIYMRS